MKRTDNRALAMARRPINNARATMAAQVVKRPNDAVLTTHDDRAFAQEVKGKPIARRGQVTFVPHHLPMGQKDLVTLQREW
jgi:hypothetical protein